MSETSDETRARELLQLISEGGYIDYPVRRRKVAEWLGGREAAVRRETVERCAKEARKSPPLSSREEILVRARVAEELRALPDAPTFRQECTCPSSQFIDGRCVKCGGKE